MSRQQKKMHIAFNQTNFRCTIIIIIISSSSSSSGGGSSSSILSNQILHKALEVYFMDLYTIRSQQNMASGMVYLLNIFPSC